MVNNLFQARIGNTKQMIFIDEYIRITQAKLEDELGLSFCPKGLALYTLLKENASRNGAMKGGKLVPEYYHDVWIEERKREFSLAEQGYVHQIKELNKMFSDIMEREGDLDALESWKNIRDYKDAVEYCKDYFQQVLLPRIDEFWEKYSDEKRPK